MSDHLVVRSEPPLVILTLNDPKRANALSGELVDALTRALDTAAAEPAVRAVILAGAGKHFSAGADLAALQRIAAGGDRAANLADSRRFERLFATLLGHPKLTVAAVQGAAMAGGCGLATACDLTLAERDSRFGYTEVRIGFVPALVSTFLTRRVSGQVARRLLLEAPTLDAATAVRLGLADELVEAGQALERARQLALEITRHTSPSAVAATKRLLADCVGMGWREALSLAAETNARQRLDPECRRGVRCFLEQKITPDWLQPETE